MNAQEALEDLLARSHWDPEFFFIHVLRAPEWIDTFGRKRRLRRWQEKLLREIREKLLAGERHIAVTARTCHGAGKTWLIAGFVWFILATRHDSRVLTTAPSWAGVENLLWPEVNRHHRESLLGALRWCVPLQTEARVRDTWYAVGASSDRPEKLEGHHSQVCACRIVDEGKAVPDLVYTATEGMLDAPETWDLWISTPSIRLGEFYERDARGGGGIIRAEVTIDDLVEDGVPGRAEWRERRLRRWGFESAEYQSRAMANYIDQAQGALFPFSWIERAMELDWKPSGRPRLGFDVAGSVDGDESVVAARYELEDNRLVADVLDSWKQADTMVSKGRALEHVRRTGAKEIGVDTIGLGKGVYDALAPDCPVEAYRATDPPLDRERFVNRKAEDCWTVRDLLERNLLRLPNRPKLKAQMLGMRDEITPKGLHKVIDPADSPDEFDAILIALSRRAPGAISEADAASMPKIETSLVDGWMGVL